MDMIVKLTNLKLLDLEWNMMITNEDIFNFRKLKNLEDINLGNSSITDMGVNNLQRIKSLKKINVRHCHITDISLFYLSSMKNLEKLNISDINITVQGFKYLQNSRSLSSLILTNDIHDNSEKDLRGFKTLKHLKITNWSSVKLPINLRSLKLIIYGLRQTTINEIRELTKLKRLSIISEYVHENIQFNLILPELEELTLENDDISLVYRTHLVIDGIRSIGRLNIECHLMDEEQISNICDINSLKKLTIIHISDEEMKYLKKLKVLRKISLLNNPYITDTGLSYLKDCKELEEFEISNNHNISNEGLKHLYELKKLREINIIHCSQVDHEQLKFNTSIEFSVN